MASLFQDMDLMYFETHDRPALLSTACPSTLGLLADSK